MEHESVYRIERHDLKQSAHIAILRKCPELRHQLTQGLLRDTLIYLEGYARAIDYSVQDPVLKSEMQSLLLQEGVDYILKKIHATVA